MEKILLQNDNYPISPQYSSTSILCLLQDDSGCWAGMFKLCATSDIVKVPILY